jgi:hypothetical protein
MYTKENHRGIMKSLLYICLYAVIFVGLNSCEEVDLSFEENKTEEVLGLWKEDLSSSNLYVYISDTEFNFYEYNSQNDCVITNSNIVIKRDGVGFFQVQKNNDTEPIVYAVTSLNGQLRIRYIDDLDKGLQYFWPTTFDIFNKPECLNEDEVQGRWELIDDQEETYVNITNDYVEVTSRFFEEDCFEYVQYKVFDITNNVYQLRDEITADVVNEIEVVFIRTSQGLEITVKDGIETNTNLYTQSNVDFNQLEPICGLEFRTPYTGLWEEEENLEKADDFEYLSFELDTLTSFINISSKQCVEHQKFVVQARRNDTFYLSNPISETTEFIYQFYFDNNVLVRNTAMDEDFFEKRFIRTSTSISELESQFCETD